MRFVLPSTRSDNPSRVSTCTAEALFVAKHGGKRTALSASWVRHLRPSIRRIFSAARLELRRRARVGVAACEFVVESNHIVRLWAMEMDVENVHGSASSVRDADWMETCKDPSVQLKMADVDPSEGRSCVVFVYGRRFVVFCGVFAPQIHPQDG